jgi:hypothetical protein
MDNFMYYWVPLLAVILIGLSQSIDRRRQLLKSQSDAGNKYPNRFMPKRARSPRAPFQFPLSAVYRITSDRCRRRRLH